MAPAVDLVVPTRPRLTVATLCTIQLVDVMCVTVVVTTLPDMLRDLHGSEADTTVIATAYAMFFGGLLLFGARLGDRIGHRRALLISVAVFAGGSLSAATAGETWMLAAARAIQGAAAAVAVPSALTLLTVSVSDRQRSTVVSAWSATGAAAGVMGYLVGGALTQVGSWRLVFWVLVGVAVLLAAMILVSVPPDHAAAGRPQLNVVGSGLVTATVMLVVVGASVLGQPGRLLAGVSLLVVAAGAGLAFLGLDRQSKAPLLPAGLVRTPAVRTGYLTAFVNTATTSGVATLATLFLQGARQFTPIEAAATLLPFSVFVIVGSAVAGRVLQRSSAHRVGAFGLLLIALGTALLVPGTTACIVAGVSLAGLGLGLASVSSTATGVAVDAAQRAAASGIFNTGAQVGTAVGTALLLLLATSTTGDPTFVADPPFVAWLAATAVAAIAAGLWVWRGRSSGDTAPTPADGASDVAVTSDVR